MGLCDCIGKQESQRHQTAPQTKTILVSLDRDAGGSFRGSLRSSQTEEAIAFHDLGEMVLGLDTLCDARENTARKNTEGRSGETESPGSLLPEPGSLLSFQCSPVPQHPEPTSVPWCSPAPQHPEPASVPQCSPAPQHPEPASVPQCHPASPYTPAAATMFTISIERREHESFQGKLRGGLTGGRYLAFQSALDLMHILKALTEPDKEGTSHGI